jgi:hypothetical protein
MKRSLVYSISKKCPRRVFLRVGMLTTAAAAVASSPFFPKWTETARAATADVLADTYNGLLAFIVPGPDSYSVAQGVSTAEPGGLAAGVGELLIASIDEATAYVPQFSGVVAGILNQLAQAVHPGVTGPFLSPFACLSYAEKVAVLQIMDSTDALKPLSGVLPAIVAFLCFSDAGVFNAATRSLDGQPVGWQISNYSGVADGRDEFHGYFQDRRSVESEVTCGRED